MSDFASELCYVITRTAGPHTLTKASVYLFFFFAFLNMFHLILYAVNYSLELLMYAAAFFIPRRSSYKILNSTCEEMIGPRIAEDTVIPRIYVRLRYHSLELIETDECEQLGPGMNTHEMLQKFVVSSCFVFVEPVDETRCTSIVSKHPFSERTPKARQTTWNLGIFIFE